MIRTQPSGSLCTAPWPGQAHRGRGRRRGRIQPARWRRVWRSSCRRVASSRLPSMAGRPRSLARAASIRGSSDSSRRASRCSCSSRQARGRVVPSSTRARIVATGTVRKEDMGWALLAQAGKSRPATAPAGPLALRCCRSRPGTQLAAGCRAGGGGAFEGVEQGQPQAEVAPVEGPLDGGPPQVRIGAQSVELPLGPPHPLGRISLQLDDGEVVRPDAQGPQQQHQPLARADRCQGPGDRPLNGLAGEGPPLPEHLILPFDPHLLQGFGAQDRGSSDRDGGHSLGPGVERQPGGQHADRGRLQPGGSGQHGQGEAQTDRQAGPAHGGEQRGADQGDGGTLTAGAQPAMVSRFRPCSPSTSR